MDLDSGDVRVPEEAERQGALAGYSGGVASARRQTGSVRNESSTILIGCCGNSSQRRRPRRSRSSSGESPCFCVAGGVRYQALGLPVAQLDRASPSEGEGRTFEFVSGPPSASRQFWSGFPGIPATPS